MPSPLQTELIQELLDGLGWSKVDISDEIGYEYVDYKCIGPEEADELISYLIETKKIL